LAVAALLWSTVVAVFALSARDRDDFSSSALSSPSASEHVPT